MNSIRLILWGLNPVGIAVARACQGKTGITIVGAYSNASEHANQDLGALAGSDRLNIKVTSDADEVLGMQADCVVFTSASSMPQKTTSERICKILRSGKNVIATVADSRTPIDQQDILDACEHGNSSFHCTGVLPHLLIERFAMTLAKALLKVEHIRVLQAIDCSRAPVEMWGDLSRIGFGSTSPAQPDSRLMRAVAGNVAQQIYCNHCDDIRIEHEYQLTPAAGDIRIGDEVFPPGSTAAIRSIYRAFAGNHCFLTSEEHWYLGENYSTVAENVPYGNFTTPYSFSFEVTGDPSRLEAQLELEATPANTNPLVDVMAQGVMGAIHRVCAADPGIVLNDATPRYQPDERVPAASPLAKQSPPRHQPKYRVAIWGPGEIGGAVTRAALKRDNIELVGAKVFSPGKAGKDLGELVGVAPIGVKATLSKQEIIKLKPDCVIVTPQPRAIVEGLDNDVLELLSSGINVITSAAYHNVTMPNWLVCSQTPSALLKEMAKTTGLANNRREELALEAVRKLVPTGEHGVLPRIFSRIADVLLKSAVEKAMPYRATPRQIQDACGRGNASLHGTGVHPTFMAERVGIQLAKLLPDVQHMRFIEAADFSYMPDGMWGGLGALGFGKPVGALNEHYLVAKAGDFYYGDVIGNVAHLLYGRPNSQVRLERSFKALPASRDFKVGSTIIRKGCAAALHMVHKGYLDGKPFFTNEECWYLGPECEFRGDGLPFGNFATPLSYTIEISGKSSSLRFQLSMEGTGPAADYLREDSNTADLRCSLGQKMRGDGITNPITNATAMAILDAVGPVCDASAGVVIDDITPGYSLLRASPSAPAAAPC